MVSSLSIEKLKRDAYRQGAEDMRDRLVELFDAESIGGSVTIKMIRALPIEQGQTGTKCDKEGRVRNGQKEGE